jgi:hypothetical protein
MRNAFASLSLIGILLLPTPGVAASVDELVRILQTDKNFKLRANAARLLGKSKDSRAQGPLVEGLKDEHPVVRSSACAALPSFDDLRIIAELEKMDSDADENVRKACKAALKQVQRPKTTAATGRRPALDLTEIRAQGQKSQDPRHESLRSAIGKEVEGGKGLFMVEENASRGYKLIGGVSCEDQVRGKDTIMFCKVNMVLARMPGKIILGSIGATGGASIGNPNNAADRSATQNALFSAFAKSLSEDLVHVVNQDRSQNGEETLK